MNILRKTVELLSPHERRRGGIVLGMLVVMAALETAGIASVMPFLGVLGDPDLVESNAALNMVYEYLGFRSVDIFLMALGAAAFGLILLSALFRTLTHYAMNRFIEMRRHTIGERLLETYLRQPYGFFLDRHSGDMAKSILSEVDQLVMRVFRPGMHMIAHGIVLMGIVTLLLVIDPWITLAVAVLIGGMYLVTYAVVRGILGRVGTDRVAANQERFTAAGEALGGIKDIKLLGREHAYLQRFRGPSIRQASHQATTQTLAQAPRFVIEAIAIGGVVALAVVLIALQGGVTRTGALGEVLPILGVYVFAGYRMLPAAQQVYRGAALLRFGAAAVETIHDDLLARSGLGELRAQAPQPITPRHTIALDGVSYTYPNADRAALEGIDLAIEVGSSVGIVGGTGAGKTTLVDVLLGLLRPTAGALVVDGSPLADQDVPAWRQALGYVPQEIFLTDSTVAENIALGVASDAIDHDRVRRVAALAQLDDFILEELPKGYATMVGERGVRLSGGQRQRIGIARALYHDPAVLVFDEATSALDTATEKAVLDAIAALAGTRTIVVIAHRLNTVRQCEQIVLLESGRIADRGCISDLARSSSLFRSFGLTGTE